MPFGHTKSGEAKLTTRHTCINRAPEVITYSSPQLVLAHLYTSLISCCPTYQLDVPISTDCM